MGDRRSPSSEVLEILQPCPPELDEDLRADPFRTMEHRIHAALPYHPLMATLYSHACQVDSHLSEEQLWLFFTFHLLLAHTRVEEELLRQFNCHVGPPIIFSALDGPKEPG